MKYIGPILLFLIFTSPLTFILSGCTWRPDGQALPAQKAVAGHAWKITHVGELPAPPSEDVPPTIPPKSPNRPPECNCTDCTCDPCECKPDPMAVPIPGDKYAIPPQPVVDRTPAPLTAEQKAGLSNGSCADGSCSASGDGGGRRGLFGRWRR